ncbi:MAG: AsmA family protein, partial [Chitinophagia bacterium]|nr:AsmA family protein [Chitinophagia bacterium]
MGKAVKKIFGALAAIVILLLFAAVLIPVLFKDKILAVVKTQMNEHLNAVTDFKYVNLSLFSHFPQLTVGIERISIVGKDEFKSDTLIAAEKIELALDLMKAINGTYDIKNIALITPRIHALVH